MSSIGILGAAPYAASLMMQIRLNPHCSLAGVASEGISLSSANENLILDPQMLIDASDVLIADGADLRYYPWILRALRCERLVYLLNPLSVSRSFFDEAHKTAMEATTCLIPALPFTLPELINSPHSFLYFEYQQTVQGVVNQTIVSNAIFFMTMLCKAHIRSFAHYLPPQQEYKECFARFFLKFENGFGAGIELLSSDLDEKQKNQLKIIDEQTLNTVDIELFHYSIPDNLSCWNEQQIMQNEQLCCSILWYLTWFEKKVKPLL